MHELPSAVAATLWSYDTSKLDTVRDQKRIITNVLNFGTAAATDWLLQTYTKEQIKAAIEDPLPGEWDAKSLSLWSKIFVVSLKDPVRALRPQYV